MFGKIIQKNRLKNHITQAQLASLSGTTRANIAKIESGAYLPSMYLAFRILDVMELPEAEILRRLIYGK